MPLAVRGIDTEPWSVREPAKGAMFEEEHAGR